MSEQSQTINTLEKLTQLLSQKHIIERQGVTIHRNPRRIALSYAAFASAVSLLAIQWPILTLLCVGSMLWSAYQNHHMKSGWVSQLSQRSCGENLILWKDCRYFNASQDHPPEVVVAIPWNIRPKSPDSWLSPSLFASSIMPVLPLLFPLPAIQIAVPLLLIATALLLYTPFENKLPALHPYVLQTIQSLEPSLKRSSYAILLFDGGSDANALETFILNYHHILTPQKSPLVIIEPESPVKRTHSTHPNALPNTESTRLPKSSWGYPLSLKGWTVAHLRGEYSSDLITPFLTYAKQHRLDASDDIAEVGSP